MAPQPIRHLVSPLQAQIESLLTTGRFDDARVQEAVGYLEEDGYSHMHILIVFGATLQRGVYVTGFLQVRVLSEADDLEDALGDVDDFAYHAILHGQNWFLRHDPPHEDADDPEAPAHHRAIHLNRYDPFGNYTLDPEELDERLDLSRFVELVEDWTYDHYADLPADPPPIGAVTRIFDEELPRITPF